ncbi:MAG: hypothetical protein CHACPFDD_00298 [Phycisphaerae bacterium]|nr:hypothetical protein [Phycisphaerae bacterium]
MRMQTSCVSSFRCAALLPIAAAGLIGCPRVETPADEPVNTITLTVIAEGLTAPVALATAREGHDWKYIVEQIGRVRIIDENDTLLDGAFLDIRGKLADLNEAFDERGLLGLAFHPNYDDNGRFFVYYNAPLGADGPAGFDSEIHLSEFRVTSDPTRADADSERLLLRIFKPQANHNGGQLAFGDDGFLYVSVGDGGNANDEGLGHTADLGNAQDLTTLLGKILRIDVDGGDPYGIPADNPLTDTSGARAEIFAWGLRNVWRFSIDTDGRLFAADVGQGQREEINLVTAGGNYGWRIREGTPCRVGGTCAESGAGGEPLTAPIIEYLHTDTSGAPFGFAVVGGYVYDGDALPGLRGQYVFADWSRSFLIGDGTIFAAEEDDAGNWSFRELTVDGRADGRAGRFVLALGRDENGELYVLGSARLGPDGSDGTVERIAPASE